MITQEQIDFLSSKFKIDNYSILREYLQLLFLKYFYEQRETEKVFFKGGTAIHFIYGSFRFSEDLDFTSILPADSLRGRLKKVISLMNEEAPGLKLANVGVKDFSLIEVIKFDYGFRQPLTIRLDFSLRERPMTKENSPIETVFPIAGYPMVMHLGKEELLAEKIRALMTRQKGRDLFDLWFLLSKGIKINHNYVKDKLNWYKMEYDLSKLLVLVEKFKEKALKEDLGKFLPKQYRSIVKDLKARTLEKLKEEK